MDDFTREHFETWLNNTCYDDEKGGNFKPTKRRS